jgi:hypothetical protein
MAADPRYLREHYASLSDQALVAINRADLVETAQKCYDEEIGRRKLAPRTTLSAQPVDENIEIDEELPPSEEEPDWLEDAAEVLSRVAQPESAPSGAMVEAFQTLEAAGIPCHLDLFERPASDLASPRPTHLWRLMVPFELNLRAASILDRDIFNQDFEAEWRTLLETVSDEDLRRMKPEVTFCGLFDRIERVRRAYDEEIARRKL